MSEEPRMITVCTKTMWILYSSLFILSLLDIVTTTILLRMGGSEINGFAVFLWGNIGFLNSVILKVALNVILGLLMIAVNLKARTQEDISVSRLVISGILVFLFVFYLVVVFNNLFWLGKALSSTGMFQVWTEKPKGRRKLYCRSGR